MVDNMNLDLCNMLQLFAAEITNWRRYDIVRGGRKYRYDQYWMAVHDYLYPLVLQDAHECIPESRDFDVQMRLSRYSVGDFIDSHADNAIPERRITGIVQLSDPSTYEGGDLVFADGTMASREQGSYVVFDAQTTWHAVSEVTKGTRYSMVYWIYDKGFLK